MTDDEEFAAAHSSNGSEMVMYGFCSTAVSVWAAWYLTKIVAR